MQVNFETLQGNAAVHGSGGPLGHACGATAATTASWCADCWGACDLHHIQTTSSTPELPIKTPLNSLKHMGRDNHSSAQPDTAGFCQQRVACKKAGKKPGTVYANSPLNWWEQKVIQHALSIIPRVTIPDFQWHTTRVLGFLSLWKWQDVAPKHTSQTCSVVPVIPGSWLLVKELLLATFRKKKRKKDIGEIKTGTWRK